uniref:Uncharacterized protein n=1 Tax=viral metagenome TaxID=1070528 RepID=A0A6M3KMJ9_9ZZZZ
MPLKNEAKRLWDRNNNRTKRYGNWRQIYHNALGMCEICGEVDNLEIHEETDGIAVIEWHILCTKCHLHIVHKDNKTEWINRKYSSRLAQDINLEIEKYGGLENWRQKFLLKDGLSNGNGIDLYKFQR